MRSVAIRDREQNHRTNTIKLLRIHVTISLLGTFYIDEIWPLLSLRNTRLKCKLMK